VNAYGTPGLRQGIPPGQPAKSHICLIVHAIDH
jgi:hypothetical protein